ncbi:MAG TPA: NAD(P)/FAD-dependent oxidoreductase [Anaerolineales bacterium]|nr:NAD(P)/FAD-dependent oxidoreductase [Anaerolineales bacterium]
MYDLIVIGGGPAGLTAAIYALRKRLDVLVVAEDLGGKTNFHMRSEAEDRHLVIRGIEVVEKFRRELEYLNFAFRQAKVEKVERVQDHFVVKTHGGGELAARSVIVATGARVQALDVPGEIKFLGKGLGYSATSYAPLFLDKRVVIVGGSELALRSAAEMATVARHVHLVGLRSELLATPLGVKLANSENVTILDGHQVTQILGNGFCNAVLVGGPQGFETEIETDGVFVEKRLIPNAEMVAHLVKLDRDGRIVVDGMCRTNVPGLFAAGDVGSATEQVLIAVGEGAKAALAAYEYLLPVL